MVLTTHDREVGEVGERVVSVLRDAHRFMMLRIEIAIPQKYIVKQINGTGK